MKTGMVFPKPRKHPVSSGHLEKGKGSFVLDSIDFASPKRPAALKARKTASCPGAEKQSPPPPNEMLQLTDIPKISGTLMKTCLLYTSPSPRDATLSRMPSSA